MTINISIKANVNNITLSEVYELLEIYTKGKNRKLIYDFKGLQFSITSEVDLCITYYITEIKHNTNN